MLLNFEKFNNTIEAIQILKIWGNNLQKGPLRQRGVQSGMQAHHAPLAFPAGNF